LAISRPISYSKKLYLNVNKPCGFQISTHRTGDPMTFRECELEIRLTRLLSYGVCISVQRL